MKAGSLTPAGLADYLRIGEPDAAELKLLRGLREAALSYIMGRTGLGREQVDEKPELAYAAMVLVSHMYDSRSYQLGPDYSNKMVEAAIAMHRVNWA